MSVIELSQNWEFTKHGDDAFPWLPAIVPGCVHQDLMANGVIEDPFYRLNEAGVQWVDEADWTYRTTFETSASECWFEFDGLDTISTIWLNGSQIGFAETMHRGHRFSGLAIAGENTLEVRFESCRRVGRERMAAFAQKQGLEGRMENFFDRSFIRKAQYMFGWDWGPKLAGCGIWKPVRVGKSLSELNTLHMDVISADESVATLHFRTSLKGEVSFTLQDNSGGTVLVEQSTTGELSATVRNPEIWNPAGWGDQPLYALTASSESAVITKQVGIKTVRLLREKDEHGESFEFEVNGRKIWCMGTNWIPDHSFPGTVTRDQVFEKLQIARDLGSNMIRVWGGGLYESDDFYDACDQMGLLVWQDFPYGCAFYPEDDKADEGTPEFHLARLSGRACLALWCGNNENQEMFEKPWGPKDEQPGRNWGVKLFGQDSYDANEDRTVISGDIGVISEIQSPQTPYVPTSPTGKTGECWEGGYGDQHYWDVWHGRGDWINYQDSKARFSSEYGFCSSPSMKAWRECLGPDDWEYDSPAVQWHFKTGKPYDVYLGYIETHYPKIETLEDLFYYSQLNQRDAMRFAIEHYRADDICRGSLIWQLNDCWPVQSWSLVDCTGTLKAAAHELKRLHNHTLACILKREDGFHLVAAYDGPDSADCVYSLEVRSTTTGELILEWKSEKIELGPGERQTVKSFTKNDLPDGDIVLLGSFAGSPRSVQIVKEPKETSFGEPTISAEVNESSVTITCADAPAFDLYLWDEDHAADFMDNFVTLMPGESVELKTRGRAARVKGRCLGGVCGIETMPR